LKSAEKTTIIKENGKSREQHVEGLEQEEGQIKMKRIKRGDKIQPIRRNMKRQIRKKLSGIN
jgi:hypothetical protein